MSTRQDTFKSRIESHQSTLILVATASRRLLQAVSNTTANIKDLQEWRHNKTVKDVKMRRFMGRLQRSIKSLADLLTMDGCESKPCRHGGTCLPRFGKKYNCLCPPHRTGENCEVDVDECVIYDGTHAGCQNNATCVNHDTGFRCECRPGYHGPLCQYRQSTCSRSIELCGPHGHCIDVDTSETDSTYKCICDWGFRASDDKLNPTCVDVDECLDNPCHPGVDCINLPGKFQCTGCPKGYHGNGQICADIDECSGEAYPCSTTPHVPCFNTIGSYHCGSCPAGYRGDGRTCRKTSACDSAPCHATATCVEDQTSLNPGGFTCLCPAGMMGDGVGPDGCEASNSTICRDGLCMNGGSCKPLSATKYICACPEFYYGLHCEQVSPCIGSPCENGGICEDDGPGRVKCICQIGFYGPWCQLEENSCGAHFADAVGNLTFPDTGEMPAEAQCDYVISTGAENSALKIIFDSFSGMPSKDSTNCENADANLTLYDGAGDHAPIFATFCSGSKAPLLGETITMTSSSAMLRYRGSGGAFSIKWETKKRECGYRTSLASGALVVPAHYMDTACDWFISAPADKHIEIEIPRVEMTSGLQLNCTVNRLEVFDGYTAYDAHRIVNICETTNATTVVRSTGPFLTIAFRSNMFGGSKSPLQRGFTMKYRTFEPDYQCGGEITNQDGDWDFSGTIESPNFGGFYPPNMDCTWRLDAIGPDNSSITDQTLKFEFLTFDVPSSYQLSSFWQRTFDMPREFEIFPRLSRRLELPFRRRHPVLPFYRQTMYQCSEDYLHLYADGQLVHDGCNAHRPPPVMLMPTPQSIVRFHSNGGTQGRGFKISYSLVCEKALSGNGTIQTWNYPDGGRAGKCVYTIRADASHAIRLKFKTIGMRGATTSQCFYSRDSHATATDYVEFSGGKEEDKQINQRYVCARYPFVEEGEFVMSASRPLVITHVSSGDSRNRGLLMEYSTVDVGCGGVFSQSSGTISSPNYPDKYLPHMHCVYQIQVPWSKQARLTFDNFDIEVVQNDECSYDNVAIYESYVSPTQHGKLLGRFCGTMLPPTILSSSYKMAVVFSSDRSIAGNGFSARFEAVDANNDCDRTFTAPSGEIVFDGSQGRFSQCDFHISVISTARLVLKMNNMSVPCAKSTLYLKNGATEQSPGFASLNTDSSICDEYPMPVLRSHGSRVFIRLQTTDSSKTYFNISYEQIISTCGGHVEGVSGSIAAPQYPLKDSRGLDCAWTIAVALGNRVRFSLVNIDDLKSSDDNGFCGMFAANRLDVLDGPSSDARLMRRYCRKVVGAEPLTSDDHEIAVRYKQHGGPMLGPLFGFMAHFSTVCTDVVLTDFTGSIQSPGYPNKVWTSQYCSWTIMVPVGNRIQVNFHNYVIEKRFRYGNYPGRCSENWLRFGDGEVNDATIKVGNAISTVDKLTETCSDVAKPMVVHSKSNVLHITYQSKKQEQNHFWLTWTTIGCGGELISPSNVSASLKNLAAGAEQVECQWRIKAPVGQRIQLNVNTLSVFQKSEVLCQYDGNVDEFSGVAIFASSSNRSGYPQKTICASAKDLAYKSHTNELFILLKFPVKALMPDAEQNFFTANVTFVDADNNDKDECGGVVEVSSSEVSSIHSPRFPEEYERGTECQWLFKSPPGYYLIYTIKEYITPNAHEQQTEKKWMPRAINNLTCQDPLPLIEGALTIYGGNNSKSEKIERVCLDLDEPKEVPVFAAESLVTFRGASAARVHMTGEDQHVRRVGFLLEARTACGGLVLADDTERVMNFNDLEEEICNVTIRKRNESATGIYVRLDEFDNRSITKHRNKEMVFGNSYMDIQIDGGEIRTREARGPYVVEGSATHEEFRADNEIRIAFVKKNSLLAARMSIAYSTTIDNCGGEITAREGFIGIPDIDGDFDCIWTVRENPGNGVRVSVTELQVPSTPNCTDSYLEFRKWNASGPLIGRWCEKSMSMFATEEVVWIKFRYVKPKDAEDTDEEPVKPAMRVLFSRLHGGPTTSHVIQQPLVLLEDLHTDIVWTAEGERDMGLLVHIDQIKIPEENYDGYDGVNKIGLFLSEATDNPSYNFVSNGRPGSVRIAGFVPPADIYLPYSRLEVAIFAPPRSEFKLTWQSVPRRDGNQTEGSEGKDGAKVYSCGSAIVPTWEWQEIRSPPPPGKTVGYENNKHCKWIIERPLMTGLRIRFTLLDLEGVTNCPFDYVSLLPDRDSSESSGDEYQSGMKYCRAEQANTTIDYTYNKVLYVHFVSDRSRSGRGFRMEFMLTCNSFDYIRPSYGLLDHILTSPGYPRPQMEQKCMWSVVLGSNRRIGYELLDLDLEKTEQCTKDLLSVSPRSSHFAPNKKDTMFCGTLEDYPTRNGTMQNGRIFIRYSKLSTNNKGFRMRLFEISEDCSSDNLFVDESEPSKVLSTPRYPDYLPHSLDCQYTLRAPNGHRLKFTVNPGTFKLESADENCFCDECDWLEIRDGPTEHSPLIGRYCNIYPPSTIYSTGNFLFVRIRTDSFAASFGFTAVYELASCGGTVVLRPGVNQTLTSPNFPDVYPLRSECDWSVRAPNSHMVEAKVTHIGLTWNVNCSTDSLSLRDGNSTAPYLMEPQCNQRYLKQDNYRSASSEMTVQFRSNGTIQKAGRQLCKDRKCGFEMSLRVSNESCGGVITDQQGQLTAPGYPGRLLPHVKCEWELRAGIGYRYMLSFEFVDNRDGFYQRRYGGGDGGCYSDLLFYNGEPKHEAINYRNDRFFCNSRTTFISDADLLTVVYSDAYTRHYKGFSDETSDDVYYVPFRVNYTRVPNKFDKNGCGLLISKNSTQLFGNYTAKSTDSVRYCHAVLRRPMGYGTTLFRLSEFSENSALYASECSDWSNSVLLESRIDSPRVVNERFCKASFMNSTKPISRLFLNQDLELHVFSMQSAFAPEEGMSFKLDVTYYKCGGVISRPNAGVVTSPNFGDGRPYLSDSNCLWMLIAPEGMVVKITITDMDIEYNPACDNDVLIVGEGPESDVIHRYCSRENRYGNETEEEMLKVRFKTVKSRSRYLTLTWTTDSQNEYRGWRIDYEFIPDGAECGFATHAMTGVVHSPKWPEDYGNNEDCLWDIQVPLGYHIMLQFSHFDIAPSENCSKDSLTISQEHSSRAMAPVGDYYFLFEDEEQHDPLCGITLPKSFRSESNRIRLTFTSDDSTTAAGFRAEWKAECGAVYRLSHGVITSPNYPTHYPNLNAQCEYLIAPEEDAVNSVIALKMLDFDLSDAKMDYNRYPCPSDYLEVRDVNRNRLIMTYCGGEPLNEEPISIKGAVGLRFITNQSYIHGAKKLQRGFKLSYSIERCGDTIVLDKDHGYFTTISSPAFPLEYSHGLDCVWNVTAPEGRVLTIKYEFMDIEASVGCDMDFVELIDGVDLNGTSLGKTCGPKAHIPQGRLYTKSNNLMVHFVSDQTMSSGGFKIVVTATYGEKMGCGGKLKASGDWKTLKPPMDETKGQYVHNLHCGWNIIGPERTMLELKLTKLDTEELETPPGIVSESGSRCVDALTIYDGYKSFSPILAHDICKDTVRTPLPLIYHTSHRVAHVYFESDFEGAGTGFELQYRSIKPDCGDWLTATSDSQTFSYESKQSRDKHAGQVNQRCQWVIQSKTQTPIWLQISSLKFPSQDGDCSDAYIEIRDVGLVSRCEHPACAKESRDRKTFRICGSTPFPPFISNTMAVQITTSAIIDDTNAAQFTMSYRLLDSCNRTINTKDVPSGRLTSPNFPNPYDHNSTCTTRIVTDERKRIQIVFRNFDFERGRISFVRGNGSLLSRLNWRRRVYRKSCDFDFLQINEAGRNSTGPMCGRGLPTSYFSWGSAVELFMKTDHNMATDGYELSYFTGRLHDGGTIDFATSYDSQGAITNIGYPKGYNASTKTSWTVMPPNGHACTFTVSVLDLAKAVSGVDCLTQEEYLEIEQSNGNPSDLGGGKDTVRARSCSQSAPLSVEMEPGADRYVKFTFKSDELAANDGNGFRVSWECTNFNVQQV
ncbi:hypothetical protein Q1695_004623 [Nippostrongylus brasiliensis]|nr:hypothetical protein Q1695_004623 [Nippostrongylus brasiliensis]